MFNGTTIDELLEIVERAEDHAQTMDMKSAMTSDSMYPGFMAEMANSNQDWLGVA